MILHSEKLRQYNKTRGSSHKAMVCHAPFVNLNFEQNGNVRACCYNTKHILGQWPRQSIKEIWSGEKADELRNYIRQNNLGGGCIECGKMIAAGNHQGVRAKYYDEFAFGFFDNLKQKLTGKINFPRVMEFELSNECNLECVMCNGYFSSSIRKNREKLPPILSPYNKNFVDELEYFLPHMTDAKFLGGEPFMIEIYLQIWERIRKINPGMRIHITTNGTFLNNRVKELIEGLRAGIILSIDSVNRETYSKIRVNGNFDKVMENLEYFRSYTKGKKTFLSLAACPITYNWQELPELLSFCIEKNIALYFNAVFSPSTLSLREQTAEYLAQVIQFLESQTLPAKTRGSSSPMNLSINAYVDFIHQLHGWLEEKKELGPPNNTNEYSSVDTVFTPEDIDHWSLDEIREKLIAFVNANDKGYIDKETVLLNRISNLFIATPSGRLHEVIECYFEIYEATTSLNEELCKEKAKVIANMIEIHPNRNGILLMMSKASPIQLAEGFYTMSTAELESQLKQLFN